MIIAKLPNGRFLLEMFTGFKAFEVVKNTQGYLLFVYYGLFINNAVVCMGWRGGEGEKFASCFTQRKRPFHDSN